MSVSLSFMVYGPMTVKDLAIIDYALEDKVSVMFSKIIEDVDVEMAEVFGTERGWNIQWLHDEPLSQEQIKKATTLIEEGLTHLKLTHNFYGILGEE